MGTLIKELSENQRNKIISLLKNAGFQINLQNEFRIEFSKGFRQFTLNSTDTDDTEFGLTTSFDVENFLTTNYKEKPKHSISLKEQLYKEKKQPQESLYDIESAFKSLGWEVNNFYNYKDFSLEIFNEDPLAESLYEVSIRELPHVILDEQVFEGELSPLIAMAKKRPQEIFTELGLSPILNEIKKIE